MKTFRDFLRLAYNYVSHKNNHLANIPARRSILNIATKGAYIHMHLFTPLFIMVLSIQFDLPHSFHFHTWTYICTCTRICKYLCASVEWLCVGLSAFTCVIKSAFSVPSSFAPTSKQFCCWHFKMALSPVSSISNEKVNAYINTMTVTLPGSLAGCVDGRSDDWMNCLKTVKQQQYHTANCIAGALHILWCYLRVCMYYTVHSYIYYMFTNCCIV